MAERKEAMFSIEIEGDTVTAKGGGGHVTVNAKDLSPSQYEAAAALGVAQMLRTSYANAKDVADGLHRLSERATQLQNGSWLPGTRSTTPKEPDDLALAVMEAIGISFEKYENDFLPNWLAKYTTKTMTRDHKERTSGKTKALKTLAEHKSIAPIMAKLAAARAKTARGNDGPALADFVETQREAAE